MKIQSLEINKVGDKELSYRINGKPYVGAASVFYAKSVSTDIPTIKFINQLSGISIEVEVANLTVNGITYTDEEEARTAINEFAGSFKKSGGTVNTYTKIEADAKFADKETTELNLSNKADLVNGVVPSIQLPGAVDAIIEVDTYSELPTIGESNKIYITLDNNKQFRWSGTVYAEISPSLALGETESTAHRGDHGKYAFDHSHTTGNPHNTNSDQIQETAIPGLSITVATAGKYRISISANFIASELILSLLGTLNFSNTESLATLKIKKGSTILQDSAIGVSRVGLRHTFAISVVSDLVIGDVITVSIQGTIPAGTFTLVSGTGYSTILNIEKII